MALAAKKEFQVEIIEGQEEIAKLVLAGLEQAEQGKIQDYDAVRERLEKRYRDAMLQD